MSQSSPKLHRLGLFEMANESTFATTVDGVGYTDLRTIGPIDMSGLKQEAIEDMHVRTGITQVARIPGVKKGTFTSKHYLHGYSSSTPAAGPGVILHPLAKVFGWAFGQVHPIDSAAPIDTAAGGFLAAADTTGSTTSIIKAANLSTFPEGSAIAFPTQSYGTQVGWITNNNATPAPDECTLLQTAAGVPYAAGDVIAVPLYGSIVAVMTSSLDRFVPTAMEGESLRYTTHNGDERYTMSGCCPTGLKISYTRAGLAVVEITWGVAAWSIETAVTAPTADAWAYPQPEPVASAWCAFGSSAVSASRFRLASLEFDLGLKMSEVPSELYAGGIGGWFPEDRRPRCTFTVFRDQTKEITDWNAQTGRPFVFTMGSAPGKLMSLCMPNARVVEYPEPADEAGALVSKVTIEAHNYTADAAAGSATNQSNKDCKFAWL